MYYFYIYSCVTSALIQIFEFFLRGGLMWDVSCGETVVNKNPVTSLLI